MSEADDKSIQLALGWLRSGQAPAARAPEVARALLIRDGQAPASLVAGRMGFGADIEMALLLDAEQAANVTLVGLLALHAREKAVAKHAKKVLFKFKQKGLSVPDKQQVRPPVDLASRPDPLPSYLTGVSETGLQFCVLGGWRAGEGPWCVLAMLSERTGLMSSYYIGHASRTQQRELLGRLDAWMSGGIFEVPAELAAGRARYGLDLLDARLGLCEGDLADTRRVLADTEPVAEVGFDTDPEDEARYTEYLLASRSLLQEPVFKQYFQLSEARAAQARAAVALVPADADYRDVQLLQACQPVWAAHIEELGGAALAQRFEFNAWLLAHQGRPAAALQALACGKALRKGGEAWLEIGLLRAVMAKVAPLSGAAPTQSDPAATSLPQ